MIELKEALEQAGWELLPKINSSDVFQANDDQITWEIINRRTHKNTVLTFYLFDFLGRRTEQLSDILYVEEKPKLSKLYFEKINSASWKSSLSAFVRSL
ncbi:hypothetical protein O0882_15750 [Janthinobacterium sp. SUN073]|uniref:hypothetical protein n=1 Tax=Janthinobacterium sp. SUN073 TaxID=3004102 RepID=UPI0025B25D93|nr:hypothetical protein [Janthinobacterium sp. SUN073]MDN2697773.1 hypothetical protein [Janthinobacterium sp. SUN073]